MKVVARVLDLDMKERFYKSTTVDIPPDSSQRVLVLPEIQALTSTYFLDLRLQGPAGTASRNFYWLSTAPETLDWDRRNLISGEYHISTWTPTKTFADYSALATLPEIDLDVTARSERTGGEGRTTVTVHNPTRSLAFGVRLKVNRPPDVHVEPPGPEGPPDYELLPVRWEDDYFSVLPGETREVAATYSTEDLRQPKPVVEMGGWNVNAKVIEPE
jgi:exo-1,4-beta-D-glucosaminidase